MPEDEDGFEDESVELPDEFTIEQRKLLTTYETEFYRCDGQWLGQATVKHLFGFTHTFPPWEMGEAEAKRLYQKYHVAEEAVEHPA